MRTKGSVEWLKVGLEFANAVTVEINDQRSSCSLVDCMGPNSVFAALSLSIPSITRTCEGHDVLKGAISSIELCKFLIKSGYESCRHRNRVKGTKDKWTKGVRRWKNRRWVDPDQADELAHLKANLDELKSRNPRLCTISEERLLEFLSVRPSNAESLQSSSVLVARKQCAANTHAPRTKYLRCTERTVPRVSFVPQCRYFFYGIIFRGWCAFSCSNCNRAGRN